MIGPVHEHVNLTVREREEWSGIIDANTVADLRRLLSNQLFSIKGPKNSNIQDLFQRNMQRIWRP